MQSQTARIKKIDPTTSLKSHGAAHSATHSLGEGLSLCSQGIKRYSAPEAQLQHVIQPCYGAAHSATHGLGEGLSLCSQGSAPEALLQHVKQVGCLVLHAVQHTVWIKV
eukprot:1157822-Pelagomonas_calceolata.AAC.2